MVEGVGKKKAEKYGDLFLESINEYCRKNGLDMDIFNGARRSPIKLKPSMNEAKEEAFKHFKEGREVSFVAKEIERAPSTTHGYLAEYLESEKVTDPRPWVDLDLHHRIKAAIDIVGFEKLRPIFEELNEEVPYSTAHKTDSPISLYAATKKSNELMAHTYSHLFGLPTTGLRFFTVYGPWGRPDMAIFLFTRAILDGKPLKIFNNGELSRDFTYIDDIVEGVTRIVEDTQIANRSDRYKLYNIGRGEPLPLMSFVDELERQLGIDAQKDFVSMQPGDVKQTWADTSGLKRDYGYQPGISIEEGIRMYLQWFRSYYKPINA